MVPRKESGPLGPALDGARVTVMGLGRFGGGLGVTRWLCDQGADVLVTDLDTEDKLKAGVAGLRDLTDTGRVSLRLGGHNISDFTTRDLVVANPAVPKPWDNRFLRAAQAAGIPITTEIGLLARRLPDRTRVLGITGSVGKSTTTAMVKHALSAVLGEDHVVMGGNIGGSLLSSLPTITTSTRVVLELSSAMLHWLREGGVADGAHWSPGVAVLTSLSPNHVDWHADLDHYRRSKAHIFEHQLPGDSAVFGPNLRDWNDQLAAGVKAVHVDPTSFVHPLQVPGAHNRANAAVALAACTALEPSTDPSRFAAALATFAGLDHRLEFVGEFNGVRFYNDSKSTTPESMLTALNALTAEQPSPRVHLIAGGYDKKTDLAGVCEASPRLAGLYTIGQTGSTIAQGARRRGGPATECGTLDRAIREIKSHAKRGDVVLLSPACASWDQFENFEQRGDLFRSLVRENA